VNVVETYGFGLLFEEPPTLDSGALMNRLRQDGTVDLVSASDEVIQVAYPDHPVSIGDRKIPSLVNIIRWANTVKPSDFKTALEQTFDWPDAEEAVARCRHKLLVADLIGAGLPYRERYELISTVVTVVAELTEPTAIHWEPAECIVQPARLKRRLSFYCNVRAHEITNRKGFELMDTFGLAALGLVDAQCLYRNLVSSEVARWMYSLARQIFEKGDFIKDGEAIAGPDPAQRWVCRHALAMIPPDRSVIDIEPPAKFAGKR
jgi:hypothetical protein